MKSYKQHFCDTFETLGYPLSKKTGTPASMLEAAEKRLGLKLPVVLADYYLVAGREDRFNSCLHRLLKPQAMSLDKNRLIFMEENQGVVYWGVSLKNRKCEDPAVHQGINADVIQWHSEHRKCSVFLTVMLLYQAVSGGFPFCGRADAPDHTDYRFERNGWTFHGEVNSLKAYSRKHQAVCLMPPGDLPFLQKWSVLAGAKSKAELNGISEEIGVMLR